MSMGIFDKFRRSESMFRVERPTSRSNAAICSALLAPNIFQPASSTELEHVSGGCWSEDWRAKVNTPKDSLGPGRPESRYWSRNCCQCPGYGEEGRTSTTEATESAFNPSPTSTGYICACASQSEIPCLTSRNRHTQMEYSQASPTVTKDLASVKPYARYSDPKYNQKHVEESEELECNASKRVDFEMQESSNVIQMGGRQEAFRESDVCSGINSDLHALLAKGAPANMSTDALSIAASSTVLSPAMMRGDHCEVSMANEGSDCDSLGSDSTYSVEADEMVEMQPRAWKSFLRDIWHRPRSIRRMKGEKTDSLRCSFTV